MNIYVSSDHAGYEFKIELFSYLVENFKDCNIFDCGPYSEESVDYPDYAEKVCEKVLEDENSFGILICGTGLGMSIAANKINGIRATLCNDLFTARLAREHNNANVLAMGARAIGMGLAIEIVKQFMNSKFEGGRHTDRLNLIRDLEQKNS